MIAVIFEVLPHAQHRDAYFAIAKDLRPILETIDGFISIERFESMAEPSKVLSLSFWRDEQAVMAWRNIGEHRMAQHEGRTKIFKDYRLRVADVLRDYGMHQRTETPIDSRNQHDGVLSSENTDESHE
ncbi:antibiotic biosynthesis monooxygenase [Thalassospira alkalitolerans]|uniref:antibiotic biosynthesis monooxygenase family protein n=1 Tax=Thalassospira alkalitolerans TaxID=1293890 RepID=UPI0030EDCE26|tara:strand:+ start:245255 stop:245638 length:384 start_codon:yes stop_codon:yes gene_type:complete